MGIAITSNQIMQQWKPFSLRVPGLSGFVFWWRKVRLFLLFACGSVNLFALPGDSTVTLDPEAYFAIIGQHHPLARRALLLSDVARARVLSARGAFDPKAMGDVQQKSFDGKRYFTVGEAGVKVPTWFGLEFKGAYTFSNGTFLNPENNLPTDGQLVLGVSVPVLQGLLVDQRRTTLKQARLLEQVNEAERLSVLNDLFLEAAGRYWEWARAFEQVRVYQEGLELAEVRYLALVESFFRGDKAAIDTLEAFIEVQDRQVDLNAAQLDFQNATLALSLFLWQEDGTPVLLRPDRVVPDRLESQPILEEIPPGREELTNWAVENHPELRQYELKLKDLDLERRLKRELLKPRLNIEYNLLGDGFDLNGYSDPDHSRLENLVLNNYKWGATFEMPLFLRKERGGLQLTDLKIRDAGLQLDLKLQEILNKINQYWNELENARLQVQLSSEVVRNYRRLVEAENIRFDIGESSQFLVNSRERKLITARIKQLKWMAVYRKNRAGLMWAAGRAGEALQ